MKIDRRKFLQVSLAGSLPLFLGRAGQLLAAEGKWENDRILVVLQLSGGNDGLSTVVPHGDDAYHNARKAVRIENPVRLNEYLGLHPNLEPISRMYKDGHVAIVQGASYPNPSRSHFKSMDVWHTGSPKGRGVDTGWVGRSVDKCCAGSSEPNLVVNVGTNVPYALRAEVHKAVSFQQPQAYRWNGNRRDEGVFDRLNQEDQGMTDASWLRGVAASALKSSSAVREAAANYKPKVEYPPGRLAQDLRIVASLISGGLPTRVFYVAMGGYDTHVRQKGRHNNLMNQLGRSVAAFHGDLAANGLGGRVVTMAFSEFGRRLKENASGGTDHGVAGPMFVFGEKVRGGIYGEHPSLTDLDRGDLKLVTDFRSVYATIIRHWLQTDPKKILGQAYPELDFLGAGRPRGWY